jgi:hypothetical protein
MSRLCLCLALLGLAAGCAATTTGKVAMKLEAAHVEDRPAVAASVSLECSWAGHGPAR